MIGVGIDLVDLAEFRRTVMARKTTLARVFTPRELAWCAKGPRRTERLAARFAAKEAALKAAGTGWGKGVAFCDAEVVSAKGVAPRLAIRGGLAKRVRALGGDRFEISLTHSGGYAAALVVLLGGGP